ncbi:Inositol 2-dehydrogenase [Gemmata sp. SH-PL17]|uniref:Gfo/Idh/MocA family protein n=1 Tax=Gemmata sp. SH-PL17 TaxID=1630693 RepID=UPI00078E8231|nr:Gfo/Idh/MocA family oxidoreductase [Gemmata sp. SH-PL17]AMV24304.1 Inositol 2-dehydrogenase [Gemmata sp. SH-PL17]
MPQKVTRRRAIQIGTAGTLGYLFTGPTYSVTRAFGANEKIRVAGIGVGGKGSGDIQQAGELMEVVALCDIDEERLNSRAATWPSAKKYFDYRKLLDEMAKNIDAVTVSTADHSHAPAAVLAMRAGKHVYCQKPLTHTVFEARLMREVAAKQKVCTQMGNQGSALNGLRRAVELIHAGTLGPIREAHVWTNRPAHYWKQSPDITARPKEAPVPKTVHWDEWIGPAPMRPYALAFSPRPAYHPHDWRGYWDFGTGALGDMACHTTNMAFRALKLGAPTAVVAEAGEINPETYPAWAHIQYLFAARGDAPACTLHWYEGSRDGKRVLPPEELLAKLLKKGEKLSDSGSILVGDKGVLFSPNDYGARFRLTPEKDFEGLQTATPEKLPAGVDKGEDPHMKKEWTDAIKAGKPALASSNFDFAGQLTETMLLGNIAVRFAGTKLEWDATKLRFTNSDAATKFVSKEYRKGWDFLTRG